MNTYLVVQKYTFNKHNENKNDYMSSSETIAI